MSSGFASVRCHPDLCSAVFSICGACVPWGGRGTSKSLMSYVEGRVIEGRKGDEGRKSMSANYQQNGKWSHVLRMIKSEKFELNCSLL